MAAFDESTQFKFWIYKPIDLVQLQIDAVRVYLSDNSDPYKQISTSKAQDYIVDHELLLQHFCVQIKQAVGPTDKAIMKRNWRVWATACTFFRRFFVKNSILAHNPRIIMLASLFIAGKVENDYLKVDDLVSKVSKKCSPDMVLATELVVLQELNFNLKVFHPHNTAHALFADMKRVIRNSNLQRGLDIEQQQRDLYRNWQSEVEALLDNIIMCSSIPLCHSPTVISIASLSLTEPLDVPLTVKDYVEMKFTVSANEILKEAHLVQAIIPEVR